MVDFLGNDEDFKLLCYQEQVSFRCYEPECWTWCPLARAYAVQRRCNLKDETIPEAYKHEVEKSMGDENTMRILESLTGKSMKYAQKWLRENK